MYLFFWVLNRFNLLRVRLEEEALGLDMAAMGDHSVVNVAIKDTKVRHGVLMMDSRRKSCTAVLCMWCGSREIPELYDLVLHGSCTARSLFCVIPVLPPCTDADCWARPRKAHCCCCCCPCAADARRLDARCAGGFPAGVQQPGAWWVQAQAGTPTWCQRAPWSEGKTSCCGAMYTTAVWARV